MSLHDMYFSKKNKNHIFSILQDLILKETGYDINQNEDYIDLYRVKYSLIFERTVAEELSDLNRVLIDEVGNLFMNDIQLKYKDKNIKVEDNIFETKKQNNSLPTIIVIPQRLEMFFLHFVNWDGKSASKTIYI